MSMFRFYARGDPFRLKALFSFFQIPSFSMVNLVTWPNNYLKNTSILQKTTC